MDCQWVKKQFKEHKFEWVLILVLLGVALLWVINWQLLKGNDQRGTFGDMFGGLNAFFSGSAFAVLIYTVLLQAKELALQREELKETRAVMTDQKEQMQLQNQVLETQNFENTFFQLLRLHNDIVNSIDLVSSFGSSKQMMPKIQKGRDCFNVFYRDLQHSFNKIQSGRVSNLNDDINVAYRRFYQMRQSDLGHYFRSLYNMVKFVDTSPAHDKHLYTNLIRAQLSDQELVVLFYNCLSDLGSSKFKPLVEKYALLKNMSFDLLMGVEHVYLYSDGAFGKNNLSYIEYVSNAS